MVPDDSCSKSSACLQQAIHLRGYRLLFMRSIRFAGNSCSSSCAGMKDIILLPECDLSSPYAENNQLLLFKMKPSPLHLPVLTQPLIILITGKIGKRSTSRSLFLPNFLFSPPHLCLPSLPAFSVSIHQYLTTGLICVSHLKPCHVNALLALVYHYFILSLCPFSSFLCSPQSRFPSFLCVLLSVLVCHFCSNVPSCSPCSLTF